MVLAVKVKIPLLSILNGPTVTGVTLVLEVVTATPFKVSAPLPLFAKTFPTVLKAVVLGTWVEKTSLKASILLLMRIFALAISQLDGFNFSHI